MGYVFELAPWERKNEYFQHIQLGKDVRSQTNLLRDAINNQTRVQLASASAVIASQERIAEGIDALIFTTSEGLSRVADGLSGRLNKTGRF